MEGREKGTVTSLASLISVEEAQKAAKRVEDSIAEHQKELDQLHHFITDNTNLIKLVKKLPDELYHDIMVPFGKAAFFPGRLIHTNEFMVLLGEGYYVERTSKQTVEVLQRRGKVLDSQVDSLKAMMLDLKAEASFFGSTAAEAAEGLVEIREDYIEEHPTGSMSNKADLAKQDKLGSSEVANVGVAAEDAEYARIMSRLDELEKEELEAESDSDEDDDTAADFGCSINQHSFEQNLKISEEQPRDSLEQSSSRSYSATAKPSLYESHSQQNFTTRSTFEDIKGQRLSNDEYLHRESLARMDKSHHTKNPFPSLDKGHAEVLSTSKFEDPGHTSKTRVDSKKIDEVEATGHNSKTGFDSSKAFTGSVVEHAHGINTDLAGKTTASSQSTSANPSKPVSRFKMQKGGR